MLFAFSITASAEENYKDIILYDSEVKSVVDDSVTSHTKTRTYIEDLGQIIYPIYTDYSDRGDTYRPIAYFIVSDSVTDLHITTETYDFLTGETKVTESILNVNNHIVKYRDLYNSNTNYYNYLSKFGFYPNNYSKLNEGPLVYKSFALIKAQSYPNINLTFTNYVDNDVMEFFFSDYTGDRKTNSSVVSLSGTYQNSLNYYDFIPYLHDNSTVKPISNPVPVTVPEPFPPEPEPEPEPLPPAGSPDVGNTNDTIVALVSKAMNIIIANEILMILFCSGLLGVAFKIIMQAKKTSKL